MSEPHEKAVRGATLFIIAAVGLFASKYPASIGGLILAYPSGSQEHLKDIIKLVMQVLISVGTGIPAVFIILAKRYAPKDKHWAYGTVGLIIGFWLR
jgi:hypothetical protein